MSDIISDDSEDEAKRQKLYEDYVNEAHKRQISSSENFDKSILTYSSGGLAISLTFLKDFIPISKASWSCLLFSSWFLFVIAIMLTTLSFVLSYKANEQSKDYCYKYMVEKKDEYFNKKSIYAKFLVWFNFISGLSFILAIAFTSFFVAVNLKGAEVMTEKKVIQGYAQDGLPSASMRSLPAAIPATTIPATTTTTTTTPASTTTTTTTTR